MKGRPGPTKCQAPDCEFKGDNMRELWEHQRLNHRLFKCEVPHHSHITRDAATRCYKRNVPLVPHQIPSKATKAVQTGEEPFLSGNAIRPKPRPKPKLKSKDPVSHFDCALMLDKILKFCREPHILEK